MNRVFKNAHVLCPATDRDELTNVHVTDGCITHFGGEEVAGADVVECSGHYLLPGLVDLDAQLGAPGLNDRETLSSGGSAAAAGGFSTVLVNPNTRPVLDDAALVRELIERAPNETDVEILVAGALTQGLKGGELAEMGLMARAGASAFSNAGVQISNSSTLRYAMLYARPFGLPIMMRAGDDFLEERGSMNEGDVSTAIGLRGLPPAAEEIGVGRLIALARDTGTGIHITGVTTETSVEQIKRAKAEGVAVTASTSAHHLLLTDDAVRDSVYSTSTRLLPPLRKEADREALRQGVRDGTIDAVASHHNPWTRADKEVEFELAVPGATGLQSAFSETVESLDGDLSSAINAMSIRPGALLGREQGLKEGSKADFFLWNPEEEWKLSKECLRSKCANSPVLGRAFRGRVTGTFRSGRKLGNS